MYVCVYFLNQFEKKGNPKEIINKGCEQRIQIYVIQCLRNRENAFYNKD